MWNRYSLFLYTLNIDLGIIGNWLTFSVGATDFQTVLPHHLLQLTPPSLSYLYRALFMSSISPSTFTMFESLNFIMSYPSLQFWYDTILYDSMVPTYPLFTFVFFLTITLTLGGLLGWFPLYKLLQMSTFYKIHMYHHQTLVWLDFDSAMILSPRLVLPPPVFVVKSNNSPPYATTDFVSRITPRTW